MPLVPHVTPGSVVASTWGNLVADHTVMRFTNAAQRTSQLPAPVLNQLSMLDTQPGIITHWDGAAWRVMSPWSYYRMINMTGLAPVMGPNQNGVVDVTPAMVFPHAATFIVQLNATFTNTLAGNQSLNLLAIVSTSGTPIAPTVAPVSTAVFQGFTTLPVTAIYRNVPAGTSWWIRLQAQVGNGAGNLAWNSIFGSILIFSPGQEFP